ncbi:MAG: tRNA (adenosine(37)-N6)-threonylcarbamoyltransferase complex dimerization subunit type 1 TsaB [Kiritimatiellaeota bacterium]|nr:tRNA (adenosine(37)-N6)-threonylcarbamoyltransferase complex dimerization subunit type 1 TsaB [Kiritimatiellota bacterium]
MITLALEMSSAQNDLAVLADDRLTARQTWSARDFHHTQLFELLPLLLRDAGVEPAAIDFFAVGRGPGSFSGLRVAITAAQALALPGGQPVFAVSSGAALAQQTIAESPAPAIAVIGDARRGTIWLGLFDGPTGHMIDPDGWTAVPLSQWGARLPANTRVVSPDWHRLSAFWPAAQASHIITPTSDTYPTAEAVARLALARHARGEASEPLTPIYLHPAVAAPRPAP